MPRPPRPVVPGWLDEMPLDTPDHVRHAWHMIGHPAVRGRLRRSGLLTWDEADVVIDVMRRRIRRAAWEHDVLLFGGPLPDRDLNGAG